MTPQQITLLNERCDRSGAAPLQDRCSRLPCSENLLCYGNGANTVRRSGRGLMEQELKHFPSDIYADQMEHGEDQLRAISR